MEIRRHFISNRSLRKIKQHLADLPCEAATATTSPTATTTPATIPATSRASHTTSSTSSGTTTVIAAIATIAIIYCHSGLDRLLSRLFPFLPRVALLHHRVLLPATARTLRPRAVFHRSRRSCRSRPLCPLRCGGRIFNEVGLLKNGCQILHHPMFPPLRPSPNGTLCTEHDAEVS